MLAVLQWVYDWDWITSEGTINTALMHGPKNSLALNIAADIAKTLGHYEKAIELGIKAVNVDPLNSVILTDLGDIYREAGQLEDAANVFEQILELYPEQDVTYARLSLVRTEQGNAEDGLRLAQKEKFQASRVWASFFALHALGRQEEATVATNYLVENERHWLAYQIAGVFAFQGNPDKAFEWLEITYEQRDGGITHILGDLSMVSLYDDPRWEPYLLKLGLLDAWKDLQKRRAEASI